MSASLSVVGCETFRAVNINKKKYPSGYMYWLRSREGRRVVFLPALGRKMLPDFEHIHFALPFADMAQFWRNCKKNAWQKEAVSSTIREKLEAYDTRLFRTGNIPRVNCRVPVITGRRFNQEKEVPQDFLKNAFYVLTYPNRSTRLAFLERHGFNDKNIHAEITLVAAGKERGATSKRLSDIAWSKEPVADEISFAIAKYDDKANPLMIEQKPKQSPKILALLCYRR